MEINIGISSSVIAILETETMFTLRWINLKMCLTLLFNLLSTQSWCLSKSCPDLVNLKIPLSCCFMARENKAPAPVFDIDLKTPALYVRLQYN